MVEYCVIETGNALATLMPKHGSYPEMLVELIRHRMPGAQFATVSVVNGEDLPDPEDFAGYVYMGSRHSVYEELPWIEPLKQFIGDVAAAAIPQVGICFGHQIMAQALGGQVKPGEWIAGSHEYQMTAGAKLKVLAHAYHHDQVVELPEDVEVTMTHAQCPYAGLSYKKFPAYSVQFHPEFETEFMRELLRETAGKPLDVKVAESGLKSLHKLPDRDVFAEAISNALTNSRSAAKPECNEKQH